MNMYCTLYILQSLHSAQYSAQFLPVLNEKKGGVHVLGGRFVPSLGRQRLTAMG
jgi:hypothetical protein